MKLKVRNTKQKLLLENIEAIITIVVIFLGVGKITLLRHLVNSHIDKSWSPFIVLNNYENANLNAI
ncbi:hypothetical protein [Aquimarina longa]|uniref:hypothetical protein n=1 Tax=Aquimarina longa TaxID=1080221 RepID=UPI0007861976|nr:hypothetical protein [Aquimarina longa]